MIALIKQINGEIVFQAEEYAIQKQSETGTFGKLHVTGIARIQAMS